MILGIGTDLVAVQRFEPWTTYSNERLLKVFTQQELVDCRNDTRGLLSEKLASRFAAKEAFYKALSNALIKLDKTKVQFSLLFTCSLVQVSYGTWGVPTLSVDWAILEQKIESSLPSPTVHLSIAHERDMASAFVVIETLCKEKN